MPPPSRKGINKVASLCCWIEPVQYPKKKVVRRPVIHVSMGGRLRIPGPRVKKSNKDDVNILKLFNL